MSILFDREYPGAMEEALKKLSEPEPDMLEQIQAEKARRLDAFVEWLQHQQRRERIGCSASPHRSGYVRALEDAMTLLIVEPLP